MKIPNDKWLADIDRRIVKVWIFTALAIYAVVAAGVIGALSVRNIYISHLPIGSVHATEAPASAQSPVTSAALSNEPSQVTTEGRASVDAVTPKATEALVENGWDFNAPDGVPGFGPLPASPAFTEEAMKSIGMAPGSAPRQ